MKRILFELSDLKIVEENGRHFVVYDAGSHQVVMRKDEVAREEAEHASLSKENAIELLWLVQQRLTQAGVDPYVSNTDAP